ncbi:MAG TPA: zinc-ribbon and DUF3426 domain-containing protein [Lamprocystis sp. (in: g-proteobacteria)]|nr:zinc-ribbon and DUF3426 domain-containing protein [Lamprocystis sp. (in: g-proteobacteria)]
MPLSTRCANCGKPFPVYAQQLKGDGGQVACPACGALGDAVAGLLDEPGFAEDRPAARTRNPHRDGVTVAPPPVREAPLPRGSMVPVTPPVEGSAAPLPTAGRRSGNALERVAWGLASVLLILAIGAQLAWWRRGELLRDPTAVRVLNGLCRPLGCLVPPVRLPGALAVLEPSLDPDPANGALLLRLRIENQGELPQPAPLIELELLDQHGDPAAVRRFTPAEYATSGTPPADLGPLAPGETRSVTLVLAPPRDDPSGFKVRLQ